MPEIPPELLEDGAAPERDAAGRTRPEMLLELTLPPQAEDVAAAGAVAFTHSPLSKPMPAVWLDRRDSREPSDPEKQPPPLPVRKASKYSGSKHGRDVGAGFQKRLGMLLATKDGADRLARRLYPRFGGRPDQLVAVTGLLEDGDRWGFPARLLPLLWTQLRRAAFRRRGACAQLCRVGDQQAPEHVEEDRGVGRGLPQVAGGAPLAVRARPDHAQVAGAKPQGERRRGGLLLRSQAGRGGLRRSVRLMFHKALGVQRAVKLIDAERLAVPMEKVMAEVNVLKALDHPHIVRIYETFERQRVLHIVQDFAEGGDLAALLREKGPLHEPWVCEAAQQMSSALEYIHSNGVIHCDLKPANTMILRSADPNRGDLPHVLLVDFGISEMMRDRTMDGGGPLKIRGTPLYLSPEGFQGDLTEKCDMWSLGVMIQEDYAGRAQALRRGRRQRGGAVVPRGAERAAAGGADAVGAGEVARGLLEKDPIARLTAQECCRQEWFTQNKHHRSSSRMERKSTEPAMEAIKSFQHRGYFHRVSMFAVAAGVSMHEMEDLFKETQQWSFTFRAYAGAFDASCREVLDFAARRTDEDQPISNITVEPHKRRLSAQIFYALAFTCRGRALSVVQRVPGGWGIEAWRQLCIEFEPELPSRFQGMLQQLLDPVRGSDAVENIYAWGRNLKQYEEQSGDTMTDTIKLATLNSKLLEGNLRTHLNLQAGRLQTFEAARNEAISYLRSTARQEQEPVPMDLSPVTGELYPMTRGGKGKGNGTDKSGKGKDHDGKGKNKRVCFYCAKPNHAKQECRALATDRANKDIKPDRAGRYMGKPVDKVTGKRAGAEKRDMAALTALSDDDYYDEADGFVFALADEVIVVGDCCALEGDEFDLLFDARAAKSVCPPTWAPEVAVEECRGTALYQADGNEVAFHGRKEVGMVDQSSGEQLTVNFEAKGLRKLIMVASSAVDAGYRVWLYDGGSYVAMPKHAKELATVARDSVGKNRSVWLRRKNSIFVIPARRCSSSGELCAATEKGEEPKKRARFSDDLEESENARPALTIALAPWPSAEEKARHVLTRCPHLDRRRYCSTGQATERPCESQSKESTVVAKKGVDDVAVEFVLFYLEARGAGEVVPRADQGPAVQALLAGPRRRRVEHRLTAIEKSTKNDSKANGGIEVAVRRVESLTRAYVAVNEVKYKTEVTSQSVILPWLVSEGFTLPLAGVGETVDFKLIRRGRRRCITRALIQEHGEGPDCTACLGLSSMRAIARRARFEEISRKQAEQLIQTRRASGAGSAEAPTPGPPGGDPGPQSQPGQPQAIGAPPGLELPAASGPQREGDSVHDGEPGGKRPVIDVAPSAPMGTDPEAEAATLGALCEEEAPAPTFDEKPFAGGFHDQCTGEVFPKELVLEGVKRELDEMEEFDVTVWKKRSEKPPGAPSTWALKLVISRLASRGESRQLASHDISAAFFHAQLTEAVWAEPPTELNCPDWLWLASKALRGARESSADFQEPVRDTHREHGWNVLSTEPCLAHRGEWDCSSGFYGDDYAEGEPQQLDKVDAMTTGSFKAKLFPRVGPAAEGKGLALRRLLMWGPSGFMLLPDPKHFENLSTLLDLKGAKPSPAPASRATGKSARDALEELKRAEKAIYCRGLARYLAGTYDVGIEFLYLAPWGDIVEHAGGDWSGDVQTCKSTSAGANQALGEKQFEIERVDGKKNPSDAGAEALDQEALQACVVNLGIASRTGCLTREQFARGLQCTEQLTSGLQELGIQEDPDELMAVLDMDQNGLISCSPPSFLAGVLGSEEERLSDVQMREARCP
ncbi:unnamed protein product [Prorocentrum cordatum]|uniref:non-specific serine/threonine protein kinase n=1 Tax=Prorocentrum cordatum TaxID=2364126 RepID=A0ABN9S360_9DINO|nr:unnamed protein product [Polarella glacialis]